MKSFSSNHPLVLLIYFISIVVISMITMNPIILVFSLTGALLFNIALDGVKNVVKSLCLYIPVFILISLTNPIFSHNGITVLFYMNDNPITLEAILYGADIGIMLIGVMYWCRCYSRVMTSDKFLYLFGKAVPKTALLITMSLRFIPMYIAQAKKIGKVQQSMGLYTSKSVSDRLLGFFRILSAVLTWALENAVETSSSMRARGYGIIKRTNFSLYSFGYGDGVMLAFIVILFLLVISSLGGGLHFVFYPSLTQLSLTPLTALSYTAYVILAVLPFALELKEIIKWNCSISKI